MVDYAPPHNAPADWEQPRWHDCQKTHDWKNYVSIELREKWWTLTPEIKQLVSANFQVIADGELWN